MELLVVREESGGPVNQCRGQVKGIGCAKAVAGPKARTLLRYPLIHRVDLYREAL
jgi:hypothetical protein